VSQDATTVTYRALDTASHEHVAVTELFPRYTGRHPIDQTLVVRVQAEQRFLNEKNDFLRTARGLASVRTRALVSVRAIFEENGTAYLVTELPDGGSLAAELSRRGQPFTEDGVFEIAQEVCTALEKLHGQSLLHLNVRPCSILRRLDGGIVLLTHGISGLDDQDVALLDRSSDCYAPMEQILSTVLGTPVTPATDVYSLAVSLVELLVGRPPAPARDRLAAARVDLVRLMAGQTPSPPVGLASMFPALPARWVLPLEAALAFHPASRTQSVGAFLIGLERRGHGRVHTTIASSSATPSRPVRRIDSSLRDSWAELREVVFKKPAAEVETTAPSGRQALAHSAPPTPEATGFQGVPEPISRELPPIGHVTPVAPLSIVVASSPNDVPTDAPTPVPVKPGPLPLATPRPPGTEPAPTVRVHPSIAPIPLPGDAEKCRIECSACGKKFVVSRSKVSVGDFKMRCQACGAIFIVRSLKPARRDDEHDGGEVEETATGRDRDGATAARNGNATRTGPGATGLERSANEFHVLCSVCGELHAVQRAPVVNRLFKFTCKRCGEAQIVKGPVVE
jgi:serine/threonine protein kinase